jgi:acyl phosphate:glycerol-3-phosphate acyltransferase
MELALKIVLAWSLGSLVGALVLAGLCGGPDIRTLGSGNAGSTNAWRTQGAGFGLGVLIIDLGRGWLTVRVIPILGPNPTANPWLPVACATAVVLGHVYPAWFGLRGGKGMATVVGVLGGPAPILLVPLAVAWVVTLALSGFVGLASMVSVATAASWQEIVGVPSPMSAFVVGAALFMIFTHRQNIARMGDGTEPRLRSAWRAN